MTFTRLVEAVPNASPAFPGSENTCSLCPHIDLRCQHITLLTKNDYPNRVFSADIEIDGTIASTSDLSSEPKTGISKALRVPVQSDGHPLVEHSIQPPRNPQNHISHVCCIYRFPSPLLLISDIDISLPKQHDSDNAILNVIGHEICSLPPPYIWILRQQIDVKIAISGLIGHALAGAARPGPIPKPLGRWFLLCIKFLKTYTSAVVLFLLITSLMPQASTSAKAQNGIDLPSPEVHKSSFMEILQKRKTSRQFDSKELSSQMVADLLWAANGVNRPESGKRTAPSAHNWQQIEIYLADSSGIFLYDANHNRLITLLNDDIRKLTGIQKYSGEAPVNLIYVMNKSKMDETRYSEKTLENFSYATVGAIAQNVYLFCAARKLNSAVRGEINKAALHKTMGLNSDQKILLAQSVGYPSQENIFKKLMKKSTGN
jgi:nitroreductase